MTELMIWGSIIICFAIIVLLIRNPNKPEWEKEFR